MPFHEGPGVEWTCIESRVETRRLALSITEKNVAPLRFFRPRGESPRIPSKDSLSPRELRRCSRSCPHTGDGSCQPPCHSLFGQPCFAIVPNRERLTLEAKEWPCSSDIKTVAAVRTPNRIWIRLRASQLAIQVCLIPSNVARPHRRLRSQSISGV